MPKKTAIEESKDLNTLKLEDLVGSLLSHEHLLNVNKVDEDSKRKKNIAFRASHKKECSDSETDDDIVEELALMSNKFKQFLKFKRNQKRQNASGWDRNKNASRGKSFSKTNRDEQKELDEKEPVTCYKCGRTGHIRAECPNKRHGHTMAVTWSDTESDSEDDRKSGLALMAHIDNAGNSDFEVHSTFSDNEDFDVMDAYVKLEEEFETLRLKYKTVKRELKDHIKLADELTHKLNKYENSSSSKGDSGNPRSPSDHKVIEKLNADLVVKTKQASKLENENGGLRKKIAELEEHITSLEAIIPTGPKLGSRRFPGYSIQSSRAAGYEKYLDSRERPIRRSYYKNKICYCCRQYGHISYYCRYNRLNAYSHYGYAHQKKSIPKYIWVPKKTNKC
ncbi:hypothetical protein LINPERHAP2_LOCUS23888 [Linum perenne]